MTTKDEAEKAARARRRKMLGLPPEKAPVPYVDEIPSGKPDPEQVRRRAELEKEAARTAKLKEAAEEQRQKAERDRKERERKEAEARGTDPATIRRRKMLGMKESH